MMSQKNAQEVNRDTDDRHWLEKITSTLEKNIVGVQYGIYAVAFTGLVIATRSVRPFKKFRKPGQIPAAFFEKHVSLNGKVLALDFNPSPLLVVDHSPLLGSRFRKSNQPGLPVKIEGVDISTNGISWIQAVVTGQPIKFTLLISQPNYVGCIVMCKNKNIGNSLVQLGFASVSTFNTSLETDNLYKKYYRTLLKDEQKAERLCVGMWNNKTPSLRTRLLQYISSRFLTIGVKLKTV